jgi:hypothetical protein
MALATTTLSTAVAVGDKSVVIASATSMAVGRYLLIGDEWMQATKGYVTASTTVPVARGLNGSVQQAHVITSNVTHGEPVDFSTPPAQGVVAQPYMRATRIVSITATSTLTLPKVGEDLRVLLNGTSVITLTIPVPTKDLDGCELSIIPNGAAAHVLTFTGGLSGAGASYDVVTINATAPAPIKVVAANGLWMAYVQTPMAGTVTNITGTIG